MVFTPAPSELQLGVIMESAAPSSSVILDLPHDNNAAASHVDDDDLVLPYISRMLMEETVVERFLDQYPDHPAVLHAQQPFAEILSDTSSDALHSGTGSSSVELTPLQLAAAVPCYSPDIGRFTTAVPRPCSGEQGNDIQDSASLSGTAKEAVADVEPNISPPAESSSMHVMIKAFFKGMEEAEKFLPGGGDTVDGRGRKKRFDGDDEVAEGRSSKQMAAPLHPDSEEEAAAREMLDKLMLSGYDARAGADLQLELRIAVEMEKPPPPRGRRRRGGGARNMVDLPTLLIRCAEAVAVNDQRGAADLLERIRRHSSPTGDGTQRLAHYFAEGLEARMAGKGRQLYRSLVAKRASVAGVLKAYHLYMASCCFLPVQFIFSNETICNAIAGRKKLHVVHYGLGYGFQWPDLLQCLAHREGGPPEVRLTAIDTPQPGFHPARIIEETGRRLRDCARQLNVPFKFRGIAMRSENVRAEELDIDPNEVLVVNNMFHFEKLMDESVIVERPNPRDIVLNTIKKMRPKVFIHGVNNGSYSASFFVTRFREALYNFMALFDMMDTVVPRDNDKRLLVEQDIFARCAMNIIACEGTDRVIRAQSYKQWEARSERAGLRRLPLEPDIVEMIKHKVKESHKYFVINEDHGWLLQAWKGRVLHALSTWTAVDDI
ncbi:hypothetical protein ACP70R_007955 [Stipagrostis hirtigluma subsp. patula]